MTASEQGRKRVLSWRSGAFLGLTTILGVFTTIGFMIGLVGAWAVIFIWAVCMALGTAQAFLYAEMATMFPATAGGAGAYANEGFRKYTAFVGPIAMWGYWLGWSLIEVASALVFGSIVHAQWFPGQTWGFDILGVHIGLAHWLGAAALVSVYLLNVFGIKPAVRITAIGVVVFAIVAAAMVLLPFLTDTWSATELTWRLDSPAVFVALVYLASWTCYGVEGPSLFAPEYATPPPILPKRSRSAPSR